MLLGHDCDFLTYSSHRFQYGGETPTPMVLGAALRLLRMRAKYRGRRSLRALFLLPVVTMWLAWLVYACVRYDVFLFPYGQSLLPYNIDLPLLRLLRKRVISNLGHGSEARPPYLSGKGPHRRGSPEDVQEEIRLSKQIKRQVGFHERWSSLVIGAPLSTSYFAQRPFVNWFALGIPIDLSEGCLKHQTDSKFASICVTRILHAPSDRQAKGSDVIGDAIARLRSKGYHIDFVEVVGQPFHAVVEQIRRCDFAIDELYSDVPMASFATECAWHGKPVVVGGYGFDVLHALVPPDMWPPSLTCSPTEIESAIESLIIDHDRRHQLGVAAQRFVQANWHAVVVARRFLQLFDGTVPNDWWCDPGQISYLEGWGQSQCVTRAAVRRIILEGGLSALQVSHRPSLEQAFLKFAGLTDSE
jgi:hypothetical protein